MTDKAITRVETDTEFSEANRVQAGDGGAPLVENLADLGFFEIREIIRAKVRKHHQAHAPGTMMLRAFCACGSHHGGPTGTEACKRWRQVQSAIIALEAEIGRWEAAEPATEEVEDDA